MRNIVLYGEHELSIDDKNRMLVPSDIRKQLDPNLDGTAFFLVPGTDGRPWLYPDLYYKELFGQRRARLTPDEDSLAYDRMMLGMASRMEWDKQGRVLFPEKFMKRSGLVREVTLVGNRDHLEIWARPAWDEEKQKMEARRSEIILRGQQDLPPLTQA